MQKSTRVQDQSPMLADLQLLSRTSQGDHDDESSINLGNLRFFNRFLQGVLSNFCFVFRIKSLLFYQAMFSLDAFKSYQSSSKNSGKL